MSPSRREERIQELRAQRALEGLRSEESAELCHLDPAAAALDPDPLELAAAAAQLAFLGSSRDPLPATLRQRLERSASGFVGPATDPSPPGS
jgi:hypothetical protein